MHKKKFPSAKKENTSWEEVKPWYDRIVGEKGHYYHQKVLLPNILRLLELKKTSALVDLGCGQGILARHINDISYLGIDSSSSLIEEARKYSAQKNQEFLIHDICEDLSVKKRSFSHASFILSLQNMAHPQKAIANAAKLLQKDGRLLIVLNHPCFRIPRQTSWQEDPQNKILYRRINRYMTPLKIPIFMQPGNEKGPKTYSFHHSLSDFSSFLNKEDFFIVKIEEWCSDKTSTGKRAKSGV